jgi:hypothetical protein
MTTVLAEKAFRNCNLSLLRQHTEKTNNICGECTAWHSILG